ncbi:uncharacterized protein LOC62_01G001052 [Vanrija pseudolonga]|uniref:Transmembrane protein n=1 Tax=Vanrija pseudolonga TaxID=143232 RepID=A0AAF1BN24_9TREE|nr:hypothetical protein LOC62_01G001052 [Vanrija pseudolonga]
MSPPRHTAWLGSFHHHHHAAAALALALVTASPAYSSPLPQGGSGGGTGGFGGGNNQAGNGGGLSGGPGGPGGTSPSSSSVDTQSAGLIAVYVVSGVLGLALIAGVIWWIRDNSARGRRKRERREFERAWVGQYGQSGHFVTSAEELQPGWWTYQGQRRQRRLQREREAAARGLPPLTWWERVTARFRPARPSPRTAPASAVKATTTSTETLPAHAAAPALVPEEKDDDAEPVSPAPSYPAIAVESVSLPVHPPPRV